MTPKETHFPRGLKRHIYLHQFEEEKTPPRKRKTGSVQTNPSWQQNGDYSSRLELPECYLGHARRRKKSWSECVCSMVIKAEIYGRLLSLETSLKISPQVRARYGWKILAFWWVVSTRHSSNCMLKVRLDLEHINFSLVIGREFLPFASKGEKLCYKFPFA